MLNAILLGFRLVILVLGGQKQIAPTGPRYSSRVPPRNEAR
jgi:hypothetical protein